MQDPLTAQILAAVFEVANTLGVGFSEAVYERALLLELAARKITAKAQVSLPVSYKGQYLGEFFADILVEDHLILELKAVDSLLPKHTAQCQNYLRASNRETCLLINFGKPKVEYRRIDNRHQALSPSSPSSPQNLDSTDPPS